MANKLIISASPHIRSHETTARIMWSVFFALLPSAFVSIFVFGASSLKIIIVSILSCIVTEALIQKLTNKKISINDGSACLTGLLLAYNLSASVPLWMPAIGGFFAIAICKMAFGGLGSNIFNPALAARAFLMASWPKYMTSFPKPFSVDAITHPTPLTMIKDGKIHDISQAGISYMDMLIGNRGGCLGEVCIIALILGGIYLLWKGYIWWHAPFSYIITVGFLSWVFSSQGFLRGDFLFSLLSGGLVLGAFYMATDYVTSPLGKTGQLVFGIGCGLITFIIRRFGGYPEGVCYSILIMNAFVPLIDRYIKPKRYGLS